MRSEWTNFRVRLGLAWRSLLIDLSNFHLIEHRNVSGFLVSGKNSGTHWVRHMLSHAMASRYGRPPPAHSSGRGSEDFVGHPRWPRKHPQLPFVGSSHNLPSRILLLRWVRWLFDLPPIVVLVRDPKEAMLSHYVKWGRVLDLSLHDYIHRSSTRRKQLADGWWYIDFFNRWGRMAEQASDQVLVVRYEDLQAAPDVWLERISRHLGLGLDEAAIAAGMAVSSREAVRATLDPAYGEAIVPDPAARTSIRLSPADSAALTAQFEAHLRHDFGYGLRRSNSPATAGAAPNGLYWARAAFVLGLVYAAFSQIGRPYLDLNLTAPWNRVELTAVFSVLTALGPRSFPRLRAVLPAVLPIAGGMVELAQLSRLAPGVGSLSDLTAEVTGVALASVIMLVFTSRFGPPAISSPATSSAARAAAARPGRRPG